MCRGKWKQIFFFSPRPLSLPKEAQIYFILLALKHMSEMARWEVWRGFWHRPSRANGPLSGKGFFWCQRKSKERDMQSAAENGGSCERKGKVKTIRRRNHIFRNNFFKIRVRIAARISPGTFLAPKSWCADELHRCLGHGLELMCQQHVKCSWSNNAHFMW